MPYVICGRGHYPLSQILSSKFDQRLLKRLKPVLEGLLTNAQRHVRTGSFPWLDALPVHVRAHCGKKLQTWSSSLKQFIVTIVKNGRRDLMESFGSSLYINNNFFYGTPEARFNISAVFSKYRDSIYKNAHLTFIMGMPVLIEWLLFYTVHRLFAYTCFLALSANFNYDSIYFPSSCHKENKVGLYCLQ